MKNVTIEKGKPAPWVFPRLHVGLVDFGKDGLSFKWVVDNDKLETVELTIGREDNPNMGYRFVERLPLSDEEGAPPRLSNTRTGYMNTGFYANQTYVLLTEKIIDHPDSHIILSEIKYVLDLWYRIKMEYCSDSAYYGDIVGREVKKDTVRQRISNFIEAATAILDEQEEGSSVESRGDGKNVGIDYFVVDKKTPYEWYTLGGTHFFVVDLYEVDSRSQEGDSCYYVYAQDGYTTWGFYVRQGVASAVLARLLLCAVVSRSQNERLAVKLTADIHHRLSQAACLSTKQDDDDWFTS